MRAVDLIPGCLIPDCYGIRMSNHDNLAINSPEEIDLKEIAEIGELFNI